MSKDLRPNTTVWFTSAPGDFLEAANIEFEAALSALQDAEADCSAAQIVRIRAVEELQRCTQLLYPEAFQTREKFAAQCLAEELSDNGCPL